MYTYVVPPFLLSGTPKPIKITNTLTFVMVIMFAFISAVYGKGALTLIDY